MLKKALQTFVSDRHKAPAVHMCALCLHPTEILQISHLNAIEAKAIKVKAFELQQSDLVEQRSAAGIPLKLISNRKLFRNRNRTEATMDDLPELPFEKVLSYLSLRDRLRLSAVSRSCHQKVINSRVKSLCFSERPIGRILGKGRWVSSTFAENFINSRRFASFFDTFGPTILSSLKHLRLCDLHLNEEDSMAFARTLNSLGQLKQLDIVRAKCSPAMQFNLNLPMLTSLQLEEMYGIGKLTLEAPRLREIKLWNWDGAWFSMEIVHGESVERLLVDRWKYIELKKLKNLQFLYVHYPPYPAIDPTLLSNLQHLKEFHTNDSEGVSELFEQKQRSGRVDLKIYLCGLLLNGPDDPAMNALGNRSAKWLVCLAKNPSRLADQIPFYRTLYYEEIKAVAPGLRADLLKRFTDLDEAYVSTLSPVRNIERFLDLLKNCESIFEFEFWCDQPQDLFDRLPEHCSVQKLTLHSRLYDLDFLFRLKDLVWLSTAEWIIDSETVRRAFEELPVLSYFEFYFPKWHVIETSHPTQFTISFKALTGLKESKKETVSNLNAAIEFIVGMKSKPKKRKVNHWSSQRSKRSLN